MLGYLWRLIIGRLSSCEHHWTTIKTGEITSDDVVVIGSYYDLQCDKCGDLKRRNLIA